MNSVYQCFHEIDYESDDQDVKVDPEIWHVGGGGDLMREGEVVRSFVEINRAARMHAGHNQFPPTLVDVGWPKDIFSRCKDHKNLRTTPFAFALSFCAASVACSEKVKMFQFPLFRVTYAAVAPIAECLGQHLCLSYGAYGGFNFHQAGLNMGRNFHEINWEESEGTFEASGTLQAVKTNMQHEFQGMKERLAVLEVDQS